MAAGEHQPLRENFRSVREQAGEDIEWLRAGKETGIRTPCGTLEVKSASGRDRAGISQNDVATCAVVPTGFPSMRSPVGKGRPGCQTG